MFTDVLFGVQVTIPPREGGGRGNVLLGWAALGSVSSVVALDEEAEAKAFSPSVLAQSPIGGQLA